MSKNKYYCRIDGKVYNLKKIQDIIDENPQKPDRAKIYVTAVEEYCLPANTMLDSVIIFNHNEIPADYNEALKRMQDYNQASLSKEPKEPRCPRCGSINLKERQMLVDSNTGFYETYYTCQNCRRTWIKNKFKYK